MSSGEANVTDPRVTVAVVAGHGVALRVMNGPEAGRRLTVEAFPCRLGRGGESRVVLADPDDPPALSREHVTLSRSRRHTGELVVTDHSRNGTCVGGRWLASGEADLLEAGETLLREGQTWVAETDIAGFFDAIEHSLLLEKLTARFPDPFLLSLVARCLAVGAKTAGRGIPQGAATSPLFSNLYLAEFDAAMLAGGWNPVRYGDDLLFPVRERSLAQAALASAEGMLRSRLHLALKPEKTGIVSLAEGFTFLGFRFTEAGRQAAPEAVAQLAERLAEANPAVSPAVVRGWNNYFKKDEGGRREQKDEGGRMKDESNAAPSVSGSHGPPVGDFHPSSFLLPPFVPRFLELFGGREDFHARQGGQGHRSRFTPCAGALSAEDVGRHLAGEETFATYLIRQEGKVRHLVLDMDAARGVGRPGAEGVEDIEALKRVSDFALDLARVCRAMGMPASLEDSGRRGRHLWIFFSEGVAPERARQLARLLALRAGFPREGVRLEILPRHTDWPGPELGDAVKLPLGVHPLTGRRCFLLDVEGAPVADAAAAMERIRSVSAAEVEALIAALSRLQSAGEASPSPSVPSGPEDAVGRLVGGCSVIRGLVARAQQTGHLRHTHQLILLYTAGRLGAEGAAFLHRTIANCRNYDSEICQGYIDRLDRDRPALGCRRIREWLEEEGETGLCTCPAARRTPLELTEGAGVGREVEAKPQRKPQSPPERVPLPAEAQPGLWQEVAEDLFEAPVCAPQPTPPGPNFRETAPQPPIPGEMSKEAEG